MAMNLYNYCLHLPLFTGSTRHGGVRRTSQISECLETRFGPNYFCLDLYSNKKFSFRVLVFLLLNIIPSFALLFRSSLGCRQTINAIFFVAKIRSYLNCRNISPDAVVFACETCYPGPSLAVAHYLQLCNYSTVLFPHNIECLVSGSSGRFRSNIILRSKLFCHEMSVMLGAEKVLTISNFDNAILRSLSVNSDLFSYYPSEMDLPNILAVRSARKSSICNNLESRYYLILGTVNNAPSYEGMVNLITMLSGSSSLSILNFIVAGYGTDKLKSYGRSNISILGAVSSQKLIDLLVNCKAALIGQSQTTGMLTRLIEFNLSMIPVIIASSYLQGENLEKYSIFSAPDSSLLCSLLSHNNINHSDFVFFSRPSLLL